MSKTIAGIIRFPDAGEPDPNKKQGKGVGYRWKEHDTGRIRLKWDIPFAIRPAIVVTTVADVKNNADGEDNVYNVRPGKKSAWIGSYDIEGDGSRCALQGGVVIAFVAVGH